MCSQASPTLWSCNPNAQLRSIARAGGIAPDSEAGMSSEASICFTPRRAVGRMDGDGGVASNWRVRRQPRYRSCDGEFDRCADVVDSDGFHCG